MMTDIPVQISNVNAFLCGCAEDTTVEFKNSRWNRTLCANEIEEAVVSSRNAWLKLSSDTDSVNPRSTRHRKYCKVSFDHELCNSVLECLVSAFRTRVHDFTRPEATFASWGYDTQLHVAGERMCITCSEKCIVFTRDDVGGVTLSRAGGGARTFDVSIQFKNGGTFELENLDNSLHADLMEKLRAEEILSSDSDAVDDDNDDDGDWHSGCSDTDDIESDCCVSSEEAEATDSDCCTEQDCDSE